MKNIYDGCLNNYKVLSTVSFKDLYEMLDKELENTLNPIVFVDISHSIIASARVVVYKDTIPDIMLNYKHKFIKKIINGLEKVY